MPRLNPWFRCPCGKLHVFPVFLWRVECSCGRVHDWDSLTGGEA